MGVRVLIVEASNRAAMSDPCSSAQYFDGRKNKDPVPITAESPVAAPRTHLLKRLWRRHRLIDVNAIPGVR